MVVTKESSMQGQRTSGISRRIATWLAWSLCAVCVALLGLALLLDFLTGEVIAAGTPGERPGTGFAVLTGVLSLAFPTVGALIASRLPANPIGWLFCGMGLLYTAGRFTGAYADYALNENFAFPGGEYVAWFSSCLWFASLTLGVFLVLLFPDGHLPSRWWRLVAWAAILGVALAVLGFGFMPDYLIVTHPYVENPFGIISVIGGGLTTYELFGASRFLGMTLLLASSLAALFSVILRLHHTRGNERQQIKWFLFAAVPLTVFLGLFELSLIITNLTYDFLTYDFLNRIADIVSCRCPSQFAGPALKAVQFVAVLALLFVPIVTYIAILRYRLYDIDVVINRTLVYGSLSACVVLIYVLAVIALGALFQAQGNIAVSLLATGLVAVLFQPLRSRLQRGVNRLMYGERDDPYAVISRLGKRFEAALAPETVLPTIVGIVREALKLPYAAIALPHDGNDFEIVAASGEEPPADPLVLPLSYGGESVGELLLAPRAPGETFSAADRRLLDGLAGHAGVAVHGVRVMADLRRSRERLVLAREEERRRLRRDLHDELAPTLAALGLDAATVGELIPTDPKEAAFANEKLRSAIRATVGDVRRLVYDLRPPALDELGLVEAMRQRASRLGVGDEGFLATVEAPDELPPLPAAVEVAAYRIVQEALTNVSRHARASACTVRLACADGRALTIEITDDGVGLPDTPEGGVGLSSMRERAAELGGECEIVRSWPSGTRVFARLPFREPLPEGRKEE
jgi:signal transduction histidine kinase